MKTIASIACTAIALTACNLHADVKPASPFTDHMVLQQGTGAPVWGKADAGEAVEVTINGQTQKVVAGADGKWIVKLSDLKAGGPYTLTIKGKNTVELKDVLIGEVWLCSGQSNMDFTVAKTEKYGFAGVKNEAEEIAAANYPQIRMFTGEWTRAYTPADEVKGEWKVCNPENVREMSAVGYFFARDLQKKLNVPVGIVTQTFGASVAEAWMRREALEPIPEMKARLDAFDKAVNAVTDDDRKKYEEAMKAFEIEKEKAKAEGKRAPRGPKNPDPVQDQHNPTVMYNGMIAPIVPYGIKGVLWYQGESVMNGKDGIKVYPAVQKALVNDWRTLWNNPELPFYNVQLASHDNRSNNPDIRAAQATILDLPHTAMAVTIDIGDKGNVHPKNKQDVGDRLARIALANAYGQPIEYSGPKFEAVKFEGNVARVTFTHAKGLTAKGSETGELKTFEVAGADGKFEPAIAKISGDSVEITSATVTEPKSVRYAWSNYPADANLFNSDGLPAAPFSTAP